MKWVKYFFVVFLTSCTSANVVIPQKSVPKKSNDEEQGNEDKYLKVDGIGSSSSGSTSNDQPILKNDNKSLIPYVSDDEIKHPHLKKGIDPSRPNVFVLPKKEFTLEFEEIEDLDPKYKISNEEKEAFLEKHYNYLKKNVLYGVELYTLNKIVFTSKQREIGEYVFIPQGTYSRIRQNIEIDFYNNYKPWDITREFLHQNYYEHLTNNYFLSFLKNGLQDHALKSKTAINYLRHLAANNDIFTTLQQLPNAKTDNDKTFMWKKATAYQLTLESANIGKNWSQVAGNILAMDKDSFYNHWQRNLLLVLFKMLNEQLVARSLVYQTMSFSFDPDDENKQKIKVSNKSVFTDFIHHMIHKSNPYFKYEKKRIWHKPGTIDFPTKPSDSPDEDAKCTIFQTCYIDNWIKTDEAKNLKIPLELPQLKTDEELQLQFNRFKRLMIKEVYNSDELLSNSLFYYHGDKSYLFLTTNKKIDVFLERVDKKKATYKAERLPHTNNNFWLKKPFDNESRIDFEANQHTIRFSNLEPGHYKIKINGQYVDKPFNFNNADHNWKGHPWIQYVKTKDDKWKNVRFTRNAVLFQMAKDDEGKPYLELEVFEVPKKD